MPPKTLGVIPSRWASSRFPGKPLHPICGKPLVQHVWERCMRSQGLDEVIIATDDQRIATAARDFGAKVCMTSTKHPSGTDRVAEVAKKRTHFTHVINVQGDEPLISPRLINRLVQTLRKNPLLPMATAAFPIENTMTIRDPNIVKVILNKNREALYFSRAALPYPRFKEKTRYYQHKGIYGYTRKFLLQFVRWKPSLLEKAEALEQLRALENGTTIKVILTKDTSFGVDTFQQAVMMSKRLAAHKRQ